MHGRREGKDVSENTELKKKSECMAEEKEKLLEKTKKGK